jgi:hypothetical protein
MKSKRIVPGAVMVLLGGVVGVAVFEVWRAYRIDALRAALTAEIMRHESTESGEEIRPRYSFSNVWESRSDYDEDGQWDFQMVWIWPETENEYTVAFHDRNSDGVVDEIKVVGPNDGLILIASDTAQDNKIDTRSIAFPLTASGMLPRQYQDINLDGVADVVYVDSDPSTGTWRALLVVVDGCLLPTVSERGGGLETGFWIVDSDGFMVVVKFDKRSGQWVRVEGTKEIE